MIDPQFIFIGFISGIFGIAIVFYLVPIVLRFWTMQISAGWILGKKVETETEKGEKKDGKEK